VKSSRISNGTNIQLCCQYRFRVATTIIQKELQQPFLPKKTKNTDRSDRICGIAVYISGPTILSVPLFPSL
jgi:hypothetical protein